MKVVEQAVELLSVTPNPEVLIERAGRTCYKSEGQISPTSAEDFIKMILKSGHLSVIEHASATFLITTDRGVSHELVRHRLASYCQESTRYCCYSKDRFGNEITVIKPPEIPEDTWRSACECAEDSYLNLLALRTSPQMARSLLPTCLKTDIVMTANFREWRHFLDLRLSPKAHPQMREIAIMIADKLALLSPTIFGEYT